MTVKRDLFWQMRAPPLPVSQPRSARLFTSTLGERGPVSSLGSGKALGSFIQSLGTLRPPKPKSLMSAGCRPQSGPAGSSRLGAVACKHAGLVWPQSTWLGTKVAPNLREVCYSVRRSANLFASKNEIKGVLAQSHFRIKFRHILPSSAVKK